MHGLATDIEEGKPEEPEQVICPSCDGSGADLWGGTPHDCTVCHGHGSVSQFELDAIDDAVWEEGAEAARNAWGAAGSQRSPCPYPEDSQHHTKWVNGFNFSYASENH